MQVPNLPRLPAKSNAQRQREFCERNPHYYRDMYRRKKAKSDAIERLRAQHPELTLEQAIAIVNAPRKETTPPVEVTAKPPLLLPAVAESHRTVTINLPQPVILIKTPPPGMSRPPRKAG